MRVKLGALNGNNLEPQPKKSGVSFTYFRFPVYVSCVMVDLINGLDMIIDLNGMRLLQGGGKSTLQMPSLQGKILR